MGKICDRVRETGIIGSLRWWYEAFVRGFGVYACDPTHSDCQGFSSCKVCKLFGCNGLSRGFDIRVEDSTHPEKIVDQQVVALPNDKGRRRSKWYFSPGHEGLLDLKITPTRCNEEELNGLKIVLKILELWGAIGSRTHLGYGVFQCINEGGEYNLSTEEIESGLANFESGNRTSNLPDLKFFFFSKLKLDGDFTNCIKRLENSLELRYDLRQLFREDNKLRYDIMGTIRGERRGSKIFISRVYQVREINEMRVWGWIPQAIENRSEVVDRIYEKISEFDQNLEWREFDSKRDKYGKASDVPTFVKENLLEVQI